MTTQVALLALINQKNEIFMCLRRADTQDFPDMWELPGGGVDPGEAPIHAAIRECYEELQIVVREKQCKLLKIYTGQHRAKPIQIHVFYTHHSEDINPIFGEGQQAWRWMSADDIWDYAHVPANKPVLEDLMMLRKRHAS